jgi:hypothetical protein
MVMAFQPFTFDPSLFPEYGSALIKQDLKAGYAGGPTFVNSLFRDSFLSVRIWTVRQARLDRNAVPYFFE